MYSAIGEAAKLYPITSSTLSQPCIRFSLADIEAATENFDDKNVLGEGGFGKVYKGSLCIEETSHVVAVKRLESTSGQGENEFKAEIEIISKLRHHNLVSLIGFCDDHKEKILVYEFMPHETLYHHLHKVDTHLSWVQRVTIAIGAARGLDYLHKSDETKQGIIHRDVKSSNILLDENWEAVISDFGLSKIVSIDRSIYTSAKGSFGYMDPEYLFTGKLTWGTDVYAFGVVLLELLTGKPAIDLNRGEEASLVRWAQRRMKERKLDRMVDANIRGTISSKCLGRFVKIADRCLFSDLKERPSMAEVATSLEDLLQVQKQWDSSAKSTVTTLFTWMIPMFIRDHRRAFPPTNPENDIDRTSSKEIVARDLKVYTFDELRRATRGFSEGAYLGSWSYGDVYKGRVDKTTYSFTKSNKGMPVVIKSLSWNKTVKLEKAKLELELLKEFSHPNLVKLIGYCLSDKQLFFVNEVMPNGNFEDHLFSGAIARLPLVTKVKIAVGIARGIAFLHNARDYVNPYLHWGGTISMFRLDRRKILLDEDFTAKLADCELTKLTHSHYPYNIRDDNGLVYGDHYPGFKPLQLQSNIDGFTLILVEVLTGKQISYDNEVQKMDDLLVKNRNMSIHNIAKLCFEICNEEDAELKMLILLEEHEMHIYDAFAAATAESCLIRGRSCRV